MQGSHRAANLCPAGAGVQVFAGLQGCAVPRYIDGPQAAR
jgi:hypothetical protein